MDQADKMKMSKFGFHLNLLGASSFLSGLGIVVSIIGTISSISFFVKGILLWHARVGSEIGLLGPPPAYYTIGAVLLLMIPYLAMWILLKIKTSKKDIPGIEKIGKVYSYVSGSLEILAMISLIIFCAVIQYIYLLIYRLYWAKWARTQATIPTTDHHHHHHHHHLLMMMISPNSPTSSSPWLLQ